MLKIKIKFNNFYKNILIISILLLILMLIIFPSIAINAFFNGILIWATKVLPSLLPFFILTKLLSFTTFINTIGKKMTPITQKLYGVGGVSGYIYAMSIVSGYPVGAKLTADMYSNNIITKGQAFTITSFTSTSGPLFVLGSVAIGLYNNAKLGYLLLISHYLSAIINGFFYRNKSNKAICSLDVKTTPNPLYESMTSSIISITTVGGFIALFYMILKLLQSLNAFTFITYPLSKIGINSNITSSIIAGLFEVTSGCIMLSNCGLGFDTVALILSFLISFGGLSIHAQALCFLKKFDMPYYKFLLQKFTQAIISTIVTFVFILII